MLSMRSAKTTCKLTTAKRNVQTVIGSVIRENVEGLPPVDIFIEQAF